MEAASEEQVLDLGDRVHLWAVLVGRHLIRAPEHQGATNKLGRPADAGEVGQGALDPEAIALAAVGLEATGHLKRLGPPPERAAVVRLRGYPCGYPAGLRKPPTGVGTVPQLPISSALGGI